MKSQWCKKIIQITFWLCAEITLNFVGLDDLADCSEFVFNNEISAIPQINLLQTIS